MVQSKTSKKSLSKPEKTVKNKTRTKGKGKKSKSNKKLPAHEEKSVVLIYANWCPHCVSMKPEWDNMKSKLHNNIEVIEIEDSDFDKEVKLHNIQNNKLHNEELEVLGYPTMIKIQGGRAFYYDGDRISDKMYEWINAPTKKGGYKIKSIRKNNKSIRKGN